MSGYPTSLVLALILSKKNIPGQPERPEEVVETANGQHDAGVGLGELNAGPEVLFGLFTTHTIIFSSSSICIGLKELVVFSCGLQFKFFVLQYIITTA